MSPFFSKVISQELLILFISLDTFFHNLLSSSQFPFVFFLLLFSERISFVLNVLINTNISQGKFKTNNCSEVLKQFNQLFIFVVNGDVSNNKGSVVEGFISQIFLCLDLQFLIFDPFVVKSIFNLLDLSRMTNSHLGIGNA